MFYELIYTRCKNGVDISKGGIPLTTDGYKVYSCSPELYRQDGLVDTEFFLSAVQAKQSYNDSASDPFMDDAYIYYVPDFGSRFMIDFHPVHYDPSREGNYTKRPGNYLNHVFAGDFGKFYVWELFGDSEIWSARQNDEPYYYSVNPSPLPARNIAPSGKGYTLEKIRSFISEGRQELLKMSVSFLLSQYALPPEERKYLVIRDSCSENIELWIAAAECAFSPLMSSGLPFATRLDKYISENVYTVRASDGKYQRIKNFQNPNQRIRLRAMIVGVNTNDSGNNSQSVTAGDSRFSVLDGVNMKANFKADTSAEYFSVISRFDDEHMLFCREFLQSLDINQPLPNLPELYKVFCSVRKINTLNPKDLVKTVEAICRRNLTDTAMAHSVYNAVKNNFGRIIAHDSDAALSCAGWMKHNAPAMNDNAVNESLNLSISRLMRDNLFTGKHELIEKILAGKFSKAAALSVIAPETLRLFAESDIAPEECLYFFRLFGKCSNMAGHKPSVKEITAIIHKCISVCESKSDKKTMKLLLLSLSGKDRTNNSTAVDLILTCAGNCGDFAVSCILDNDPEITASFSRATKFCDSLVKNRLDRLIGTVLKRSVKAVNTPEELAALAKFTGSNGFISDNDRAEIFAVLDSRVKSGSSLKLSEAIQMYKPECAVCSASANIMGLAVMKTGRAETLKDTLRKYASQGFPNMMDENFINDFCNAFMNLKLKDDNDLAYMYELLFRDSTPNKILSSVVDELVKSANDSNERWIKFLVLASKSHREKIIKTVLDVIFRSSSPKKILKQLDSATPRRPVEASEMFADIEELFDKRTADTPKSMFGRFAALFGNEER